jgi:CheY-like chemotaxis protein
VKKLLLVDADPLRRCVLDVSLRRSGYGVATACDSAEALEKIDTAAPDLVITDTRAPELDGFALVQSLKDRADLASVPVVFLASEASEEDRQRALDMGVDDYLTRPVYVRELTACIELRLARRTRESVTAQPSAAPGRGRLTGSTHELAFVDLLLNIEALRKSGVAHVRNEMHEAHVFFRDGNIVDAELGTLRGEEVIHRTLLWDEASFEVEFKPVANKDVIRSSTQALVMRGMDRVDEWVRRVLPGVAPVTLPHVASPGGKAAPSAREAVDARVPERPVPLAAEGGAPPAAEGMAGPNAAPRRTPSHRPSSAPWSREVGESAEPAPDAVIHAAGVPHAIGEKAKRVRAAIVAGGGLLVILFFLEALRTRQLRESQEARSQGGSAIPVAVEVARGSSAPATISAPSETAGGASGVESPLTADSAAVADSPAAPFGVPSAPLPENVDTALAPAALASGLKAQETPLNVWFEMHSRSPLVREAQRFLLKGNTERAATLAQQAISADTSDADAWLTLAAARKAAGDIAGAGEAYRSCIAQARTLGVTHCRALAQGTGGRE